MEAAVEIRVEAVKSFKYLGVEIHLRKEDTVKATTRDAVSSAKRAWLRLRI